MRLGMIAEKVRGVAGGAADAPVIHPKLKAHIESHLKNVFYSRFSANHIVVGKHVHNCVKIVLYNVN